jgi:ABC-type nickel/cobalt efflux system permease component RcnA
MSATTPALLAAAAGVGFGHAILPDHWLPLAVLGRSRRYPLVTVARLSGLAGVAHVLLSIVLGAVIIAVGLQFRSTIQSAQDTIVGGLLIATGVGFAALELTGHGHHHSPEHGHSHEHGQSHSHEHSHSHSHTDGHSHEHEPSHDHGAHRTERLGGSGPSGLAAVMVPFGAAASPDLTILPVFLAATAVGVGTAIGSIAIFAAVTIGTIVGLTLLATTGGHQIHGEWLERRGNTITASVLVIIGILVLAHVI